MTPGLPGPIGHAYSKTTARRRSSPLFRKHASLLLGLVGGVLLVNAAIEAYYSYAESRAALAAVQHEKARGAAAVIEQYINGIEGQIGWTTHAGILQDAQGTEQRRFDLLRLLRQAPAITELQFVDAQGREQLQVSRLAMDVSESGLDLSGDMRFTEARAKRRYVSPVYFRKESEPYLTMAVAGQGRSSGVTIAEVNLKFIWDVVSRIQVGKAGTAYVVDRDGLLIAHPDIGLVLRKTDVSRYAHIAAARAVRGDDAPGVVATDWSGREVLSASAPIETLQWHVLVDLPVKEAFEPIWRALRRSGAFVLGALGLAALAGLWLARRMTVPIAALAAGAQRIGSGDLDHRIDIKTGDEIESLAASFNDMSAQLKAYYAGLESTVAERTRELREALDHETATGEVLSAISRSPNHLQPVLDTLVATASRLCNAPMVAIHVLQEGNLPGRARCGFSAETTERLLALKHGYDDRGSLTGRVMLERKAVHIPDTQSDPEYTFHEFTAITGARSMLGVPLVSAGEPRGILLLYRTTPTAFTPRQIALMDTFADQAVIAIENARLFEAEQTRTRELQESLKQQTATADVLKAISRSAFDEQRVLDTLVEAAVNLCGAKSGVLRRRVGESYPLAASFGVPPDSLDLATRLHSVAGRGTLVGRVALEGRTVQIADVEADPDYEGKDYARRIGFRATIGTPLMREGRQIGFMSFHKETAGLFTPKQVDVFETFADQAVIAIENARLFEAEQTRTKELQESLEYQTAISDVLAVISTSPSTLAPVFDTIVATARRLCHGDRAMLRRKAGDVYPVVASSGLDESQRARLERYPRTADRGTLFGRAVVDKATIHLPDITADPEFTRTDAPSSLGVRAGITVPLMRDGAAIGVLTVMRERAGPFEPRQIQLLETFARQAIIAIENTRLFEAEQARTKELTESLEYQTATSEVLSVISKSPSNLAPVIDAIVGTAHRLCQAEYTLFAKRGNDGRYHVTASQSADPMFIDWVRTRPMTAGDGSMIGIVAADGQTTHFPDCLAETRFTDLARQQRSKARTMLGVPLLRGGEVIGVIFLARTTVHAFSERQIGLVTTFADQAVIAIENARLFEAEQTRTKELTESLEYQTAMADVLGVISRSQFALEPVLQGVVDTAARLCHADKAIVYRQSDGVFRYVAGYGKNTPAYLEIERSTPIEAGQGTLVGRTALAKAPVQIADALGDPAYEKKEDARIGLLRTMLGVPLLRDGEVIGIIALGRERIWPFETREIALVETFADQAVIAFENTRLFEAEQTRTKELTESLEYQTAISEVLAVISRSPGNVQPVLDAILSTAQELCEADRSSLWRLKEGTIELAAHLDHWPGHAGYLAQHPVPNDRTSLAGRVIADKRTIHITDRLSDDSEIPANEQARAMQARTMLGVPLLLDGQSIGSMSLVRNVVRPFSERQVKLVETFADQAVIAIQNARLFEAEQTRTKELQQSLDRQTATAQVLGVISRSPNEVQPVLDTIVTTARALCQAERAIIWRLDDQTFSPVAHDGLPDDRIAAVKGQRYPADRTSMVGRAVLDRRAVQVADVLADPELAANRDFWQAGNVRAVLATPLLSKGVPIGAITVSRTSASRFDDKQVELVESFADQAVIAIENARLFEAEQTRTKELQESLEYQTATSEVLGVISKSPNDLKPVLDAITQTAARLCDAEYSHFRLLRDGAYHVAADHGYVARDVSGIDGGLDALRRSLANHTPIWPGRDSVAGRAALECRTIQVENIMEDAAGAYSKAIDPTPRTVLGVPLVKGGVAVGVIMLFRRTVQPFNGRQIALVNTFAEQALIAMENTRLFEEVQTRTKELTESLEYQTATSEVLGVISKSPNAVEPVFEAIITMAERLCHADFGFVYRRGEDSRYHLVAAPRATPEYLAYRRRHPVEPNDGSILGDALHAGRLVHVSDVRLDPKQSVSKTHAIGRIRSALAVPLMSAGAPVGVIGVIRSEPNAFTRRQIALVETFADQAVIAIENARLLKEIQDRSAELARSVGDLKALSEIGKAVSSTLDPKTVLSLVVERAVGLAAADAGIVFHFDEGDRKFGLVETFGLDATSHKAFYDVGTEVARTAMSPAVARRTTMQIEDLRTLTGNPVTNLAIERGLLASLTVPMVAGDRMLGTLTILRRRTGAFAPGVVAMIESFANQSAIALQNARLFDEIAEKSRQIEIASQHKSQFLANMSHELRTPLNAILGYTELMQDGIYGALPEKAAGVLTRVQSNGRHLLGLINSVLDLSKIEAGQLVLDRAEYAMDAIVQNAVVATESLATEKKLSLTADVPRSMPRGIGDERRLAQVLLNLIGNAIKFTDEGGIRISASCVGGRFHVAVSDTGPGIPADHVDRIFEEFHQVDSSNTKEKGGTGLGLSIAKRIVEMHGGRIWVESEPGRGATFTFEVPVEASDSQDAGGPSLKEVS